MLHLAPSSGGHVSIRLDPQELGGVRIEVRRGLDGTATVTLAVERPETLRTLQADIAHLHQALDRAGLPADQRSVTLHLAPAADQAGNTQAGDSSQTFQGEQRSAQQHQPNSRAPAASNETQGGSDTEPDQPSPARRWARAGFDITA